MSAIIETTPIVRPAITPLPQGDSCVLVIFGASGDLTRRKLIPALYDLACIGCVHPQFEVLGIGRTHMTSEEFRTRMQGAAAVSKEARNYSEEQWAEFQKRLSYLVGDPNSDNFYSRLRAQLEEMRNSGSSGNHLFYVSTPASVAHPIIEGLGAAIATATSKKAIRFIGSSCDHIWRRAHQAACPVRGGTESRPP